MISIGKRIFSIFFCFLCLVFLAVYSPQAVMAAKATKSALPKVNAAFEVSKMSDMTDYDPSNPVIPTGDTIKIALVASFSGPAALNSYIYFAPVQWAAHDINKRGGIMVDGKKKFVEIIKADHMSKADQCKKICERMVLQEKVHVLWGTDGSNMMKIINEVANKYKIVSVSAAGVSDDLMTLANFGRYSFFVRRAPSRSVEQWHTTTARSGKRKRSSTSCARTILSDMVWRTLSRRD